MDVLKLGMKGEFYKTISEYDVYGFAGISGDLNRFHVDETFAKTTFFKKRIAHGVLLLSFVSNVMGMQVPGIGTVITSLSSEFKKPAYIGDTVRTETVISEMNQNKLVVEFTCSNQSGDVLVTGKANVTVPKNRIAAS